MSENVQDAEKAWEEHIAEVAPYPAASFPDPEAEKRGRMYKSGYMAGRASRDAEVDAFVIAQRILREQLAAAERERDELLLAVTELPGYTNLGTFKEAVSIMVMDCLNAESALAEAQATIERVRAYANDRAFHARGHLNTVNSGRIASDLLAILSAPSSTGGANNAE